MMSPKWKCSGPVPFFLHRRSVDNEMWRRSAACSSVKYTVPWCMGHSKLHRFWNPHSHRWNFVGRETRVLLAQGQDRLLDSTLHRSHPDLQGYPTRFLSISLAADARRAAASRLGTGNCRAADGDRHRDAGVVRAADDPTARRGGDEGCARGARREQPVRADPIVTKRMDAMTKLSLYVLALSMGAPLVPCSFGQTPTIGIFKVAFDEPAGPKEQEYARPIVLKLRHPVRVPEEFHARLFRGSVESLKKQRPYSHGCVYFSTAVFRVTVTGTIQIRPLEGAAWLRPGGDGGCRSRWLK